MRNRFVASSSPLVRARREPGPLAHAVAVGLFVGTLPSRGPRLPIRVGRRRLLPFDLPLTRLAANLSNPPVAPFQVAAKIGIGEGRRKGRLRPFDLEQGRSLPPDRSAR